MLHQLGLDTGLEAQQKERGCEPGPWEKNFNGEAPWAILAFYFVRLPKSVQIRNIESSEFGPAVAICPVYIEARFGQIAEPMSLV